MSRIIIDARIMYTSTGRYVERLIQNLQKIDAENEYTVLLLKKDYATWTPMAPNFRKLEADFPSYTFSEQWRLWRLLNRLKPDLVHFTMPQHPILYRHPFVLTVHDLTLINYVNRRHEGWLKDIYRGGLKPKIFRHVLRHGVQHARRVITPTDYVRAQITGTFQLPAAKVVRTYEAGDVLTREPAPVKNIRTPFMLYVGNAYPYKNLSRLVDAFAKLPQNPQLQLVIAGKTDVFYQELKRYAEARGIVDVNFPGYVSDAQLQWLYQHAQLYVFPSLSEGFGLPGMEAMLNGLPVAAARATCLPEVYGEAAVYFNPLDTTDIARVIGATLADQKLLARLRVDGKKRARQFSWQHMAEQTLEVYSQALQSPNHGTKPGAPK